MFRHRLTQLIAVIALTFTLTCAGRADELTDQLFDDWYSYNQVQTSTSTQQQTTNLLIDWSTYSDLTDNSSTTGATATLMDAWLAVYGYLMSP